MSVLLFLVGEKHSLERYIRIAALLPEKGVRDVALRIRWMSKKENGKRRKPVEDSAALKKSGSRREKGNEKPSIFSMHSPVRVLLCAWMTILGLRPVGKHLF